MVCVYSIKNERVMVILELDGEEAVVVHSKELMQNQKNNQKVLENNKIYCEVKPSNVDEDSVKESLIVENSRKSNSVNRLLIILNILPLLIPPLESNKVINKPSKI